MGSQFHDTVSLADATYREGTYTSQPPVGPMKIIPEQLAAAGYYHTLQGQEIKCYICSLVIDCTEHVSLIDVNRYHLQTEPTCQVATEYQELKNVKTFDSTKNCSPTIAANRTKASDLVTSSNSDSSAPSSSTNDTNNVSSSRYNQEHQQLVPNRPVECKGFNSFDSLRYERERLATFIDWPVKWLSPECLAKEGFYYLRDCDHCSCVFCRGVVGSWETGDIPSREHVRHFPRCPFIRNQPVGNIPITQGDLLASLPIVGPCPEKTQAGEWECMLHSRTSRCTSSCKRSKVKALPPPVAADDTTTSLVTPKTATHESPIDGLPVYSGPRRKEYIMADARVKSYKDWPSKVKQSPQALANAGFFYCGLSDHVRCFHCNNGLRNWEAEDDPWVEHARWYPRCNFVLLSKGPEYIYQVRREKPPYFRLNAIPSLPSMPNGNNNEATNAVSPYVIDTYTSNVAENFRVRITDTQLNILMELDIMKAVLEMGFSLRAVKKALRQKIEETGVPFFNLETCTEKVLACNEEIMSEAEEQQEAKISGYQREREERIRQSHEDSLTNTSIVLSDGEDVPNSQRISNSNELRPLPRTPIITSPVMPPRREHHDTNSGASTAVSSNITMHRSDPLNLTRAPRDIQLILGESSGASDDLLENLSPLVGDRVVIMSPSSLEAMETRSSTEIPVVQNNDTESRDVTPTNDVSSNLNNSSEEFDRTSTPIDSHNEQSMESGTADITLESQSFGSSSSSTSNTFNEESLKKHESLSKKLSVGSSKYSGSSTGGASSSIAYDAAEGSSSDEGNTSMSDPETETLEEELARSRKKVKSLKDQLERERERRCCKVCMDAEMSVVFLPCMHMATCTTCTLTMESCPICRTRIVHAFTPNIVA